MAKESKVTNGAAAQPAAPEPETVHSVARQLAADYKADVYLFNGAISEAMYGRVVEGLSNKKHPNTLLVLVTLGGDANAGYRIARIFQSTCQKFTAFIPSYCKSAGTLVALGANSLIMSPFSELGPLDVQLAKMDELGERRSGLTSRSALDSLSAHALDLFSEVMMGIKRRSRGRVRFRTAAELSAQLTVGLLAPIYGQMDPVLMGEDHRDLHVALDYGSRLAEYSGNVEDNTVWELVHDYPSHDFVIDFEEAKTMFKRVEQAKADLYKLVGLLSEKALQPLKPEDGVFEFLSEVKEPEGNVAVQSKSKGEGDDDGAQQPGTDSKVVRI
jgi:hypothetical protein